MIKVSDYIVEVLNKKGSNIVYGYIGGMITHLVDSIHKSDKVKYIQVYHEQTAAIAAEGYARVTGKTGIAIATSGPGATNMITGIANAYFDSIPVIYITGQVNTHEIKYNKPIRQQGFQETDVISLAQSITKYSKLVDKAEDIPFELEKAFHIANSGRKGPVLLDIPMNIQRTEIDINLCEKYKPQIEKSNSIDWNILKSKIQSSSRPMILVGGGMQDFNSIELLNQVLCKYNIPFVCSLMGKGAIDESNTNFVGMIGSYGNRCANMAIHHCDLLIALGTRLDTRQTGAKIESFIKNGSIIHVDIDEDELNYHRLENRIRINASVDDFLKPLLKQDITIATNENWINFISKLKEDYNQQKEVERFVENKTPYTFMKLINECVSNNSIFTVDIGQNQMWAAQTLTILKDQMFLTSGGHAPMGYALQAAIGASMGQPDKKIVVICGDGGFHIATQALMLISQYNLPITVFVFNNHALGMITQFQELYFEKRMAGTDASGGYLVPDIEKMASSYSIPYNQLTKKDIENSALMTQILSHQNSVVEIRIEGSTKVSPKLEYNRPINEPSPYILEEEHSDLIVKYLKK